MWGHAKPARWEDLMFTAGLRNKATWIRRPPKAISEWFCVDNRSYLQYGLNCNLNDLKSKHILPWFYGPLDFTNPLFFSRRPVLVRQPPRSLKLPAPCRSQKQSQENLLILIQYQFLSQQLCNVWRFGLVVQDPGYSDFKTT